MKPQTRQLVRLLADDAIAGLTASLRDQPLTAPQIGKAVSASEKTVAHRYRDRKAGPDADSPGPDRADEGPRHPDDGPQGT